MSYSKIIQESREDAHNRHIATKIKDPLDQLRRNPNEQSPRRWVWELIQNAKDVAHENTRISIEIKFSKSESERFLEFKHNGKPFSIKNLTSLIEQVSAKGRSSQERKEEEITGKFGTGFLTTHLLSEKVQLKSIVQEADKPYKRVDLTLDRSGKTLDEIIESVKKSYADLNAIVSGESYQGYSPTEFNTAFRYELNNKGIIVAEKGLEDLHHSLIFTLAFLPKIKTVRIVHEDIDYEMNPKVSVLNEIISIHSVTKTTPTKKTEANVAVLKRNDTTIAFEIEYIDNQIYIKEFSSLTPKLFCDFPLIGSELFPFPVIINSTAFNPTEPRDSVLLTNVEEEEILQNKKILLDAVELYHILLDKASQGNWGNIHLLTAMPKVLERKGVSKEWFEKNVLSSLKDKILTTPIVDTQNHGRVSILNGNGSILFPSASNKELRSSIWDLYNQWNPSRLPRKRDVEIWAATKWLGAPQLSLKILTQMIEKEESLNGIKEVLVKPNVPTTWLNSYYEIVSSDSDFLKDINNDNYVVIPNQHGNFRKYSDLRFDDEIEEELKNALEMLGVNCRKYLRHNDIQAKNITHLVKSQEDIILEINKLLKERRKDDEVIPVYHFLLSLFSIDREFPRKREAIYNFSRMFFSEAIIEKRIINKWSEDIWQEVDRSALILVIRTIAECGTLRSLGEFIKLDKVTVIDWLDSFISFLIKYGYEFLLAHKKAVIFPNQNGTFLHMNQIFLDNGEIDETLKDISALLGDDPRHRLLELNIELTLPESRTINEDIVAKEILSLVTPKFSETPRTQDTKAIFKDLFSWLRNNEEKAEKYFKNIHTHKFIDDDQIEEYMKEVDALSGIKEEFGVDLSEIKQILEANRIQTDVDERVPITIETLASLGVSSVAELEDAMKNEVISSKLIHTPTSTEEMLRYVRKLITRAKERIIRFLQQCPEYDCSELEETYDTIIGGVKKNGIPIYIVARPSDGHKVIIFSTAERDVLEHEPTAELWIDDGNKNPVQLTLGRVLKNTGINRIPL